MLNRHIKNSAHLTVDKVYNLSYTNKSNIEIFTFCVNSEQTRLLNIKSLVFLSYS